MFRYLVEERVQCCQTRKVRYTQRVDYLVQLPAPIEAASNRGRGLHPAFKVWKCNLHVHVNVCVYSCVCISIRMCLLVCVCMCLLVSVCAHLCMYVLIGVYVCVYGCVFACV